MSSAFPSPLGCRLPTTWGSQPWSRGEDGSVPPFPGAEACAGLQRRSGFLGELPLGTGGLAHLDSTQTFSARLGGLASSRSRQPGIPAPCICAGGHTPWAARAELPADRTGLIQEPIGCLVSVAFPRDPFSVSEKRAQPSREASPAFCRLPGPPLWS